MNYLCTFVLLFVELDMVISVSKVKDGDFEYVKNDIEAVREATGALRFSRSSLCAF